jgi:phosphohistidine phosphatase
MILYVVRHALAEDLAAGGDEARRLTQSGRERTIKAAAGMRLIGMECDLMLSSPLARAFETAEIIASVFGSGLAPRVLPELATGVAPAGAVAALAAYGNADNLMVVGHEPQLSAIVSILLAGAPDAIHLRMRKGGCVALDLPASGIEPGAAELLWMMTQRQLRRLRK